MGNGGKRYCRGQAITELVVCLIGICFIVLGMLLVSVVGSKGVRNILEAREDAERNMVNGTGASSARSIGVWHNIEPGQGDGLYFTADDTAFPGGSGNSGLFSNELVTSDPAISIPVLAGKLKSENYIPFSALESSQFFLRAADLKEGKSSLTDPLGDKHLHDLKRALQRFGVATDITIDDKLYLPESREKK